MRPAVCTAAPRADGGGETDGDDLAASVRPPSETTTVVFLVAGKSRILASAVALTDFSPNFIL